MRSFDLEVSATESSRVIAGEGALAALAGLVDEHAPDGIAVLHDAAIDASAERLGLEPASIRTTISLEVSEEAKCFETIGSIATRLQEAGLSRRSLLLAVGGGVTTDIGGLVAALYMRGIRSVFVPTTLLGMVDASLGGKNGIHLGGGKNMLGTIRQPDGIVADPVWLQTLDETRLREGLVETLKVAAVRDAARFSWLTGAMGACLSRDPAALGTLIEAGLELKADVVRADAREGGLRQLLNYGHTVGHAIESLTHFEVSHGHAVAIGMAIEDRMVPHSAAQAIRDLLARLFPLDLPAACTAEALWSSMQGDKKAAHGAVRIALPAEIGRGQVVTVTREDLERALLV